MQRFGFSLISVQKVEAPTVFLQFWRPTIFEFEVVGSGPFGNCFSAKRHVVKDAGSGWVCPRIDRVPLRGFAERQTPLRAKPGALAPWTGAEIARPKVQRPWQPCSERPKLL